MPLHAIMADSLKHHLNNVECQFMSKGIRHYPLQTYFILKKIRKIVVVVVHYKTRSLNTLSGNGHNYICSAETLCILCDLFLLNLVCINIPCICESLTFK